MYELIRASAGSGKTFRLSGHFLRQLFDGHAPHTILATTFTRKAAGEILGRVLTRLAKAAADADECRLLAGFLELDQVTQERASELLSSVVAQLHRMKICTLDAFFQTLARSLTLELGLPPGWNIIDEHSESKLRQQAIDAVLAQQMPKDAQRLLQMLAKGNSKRSVRDLIENTVREFHDTYLLTGEGAWNLIGRLPKLSSADVRKAADELHAFIAPTDLPDKMKNSVLSDVQQAKSNDWETFFGKGVARNILLGKAKFGHTEIAPELVEAYQPLVNHAKAVLLEEVANQTRATYNLIDRFDQEYSRLRAEQGWMGFNDVTRKLARSADATTGERTNFRLDSSMQHLLLDEFQDTSPDQWKILKRIALSIVDSNKESSFFCVGDAKQAIYGWRGGVAEILDAVENTIPGIHSDSLDKSRRSSPAVIETVNKVFTHLHQHNNLGENGAASSKWQQKYPEHSTANEDLPGYTELRTAPYMSGEKAAERRAQFFPWVAQQIKDLHQRVPGASVGVLVRKNDTVARLVHELRSIGVAASEEGGTSPDDSPAALAVMSLFHLASHPGDEIGRFHVATSPLGALLNLHTWKDDAAAAEVACAFRKRLANDGYGRTMQWLSDGIQSACSQRDQLRLQQITGQGWLFDQSPSLNPAEFVRVLESSRLNRSQPAAVRVMTIHQSKGLEFDSVVLPELDGMLMLTPKVAASIATVGQGAQAVCVWRNKALRSLLPEVLQQAFDNTIARQTSEALCLLYVALTRARNSLHMWIPPSSSDRVPKSYAGLLRASLTEDQQAPADKTLFEHGNAEWFESCPELTAARLTQVGGRPAAQITLAPMKERRRGLRREAPSRHEGSSLQLPALTTSRSAAVALAPASGGTSRRSRIDPRVRGTMVHEWFEAVTWLDEGSLPSDDERREMVASFFVDDADLNRLLADFHRWLESPGTRALLTKSSTLKLPVFQPFADEVKKGKAELVVEAERPFVLNRNGALVQGTIDRLVLLMQNGKPVAADIVDYKTDAMTGEKATWIAERAQHYGSQLEAYQHAVHTCFRIPEASISSRLLLLEADVMISPHRPPPRARAS